MLVHLHQSLLLFVCLILSITLHEFGHAWMADRLGDTLPRRLGRVTLNPLAHADRLGTFILPAVMIFTPVLFGGTANFIFGWGKPVMISLPDPENRKRDEILTAIAGPGMNLLLALAGTVLLGLFGRILGNVPENVADGTIHFLYMFISLNFCLMIFNLIPIPPLDGSRVLRYAVKMPDSVFEKLTRYSLWIMLALIFIPVGGESILSRIIGPVIEFLVKISLFLANLISGGVLF